MTKQEFLDRLKNAQGEERLALQGQLRGLVETLPEKQKLVLSLKWYEHLSDKELATLLAVSTESVTKLHEEAIDQLYRGIGGAA